MDEAKQNVALAIARHQMRLLSSHPGIAGSPLHDGLLMVLGASNDEERARHSLALMPLPLRKQSERIARRSERESLDLDRRGLRHDANVDALHDRFQRLLSMTPDARARDPLNASDEWFERKSDQLQLEKNALDRQKAALTAKQARRLLAFARAAFVEGHRVGVAERVAERREVLTSRSRQLVRDMLARVRERRLRPVSRAKAVPKTVRGVEASEVRSADAGGSKPPGSDEPPGSDDPPPSEPPPLGALLEGERPSDRWFSWFGCLTPEEGELAAVALLRAVACEWVVLAVLRRGHQLLPWRSVCGCALCRRGGVRDEILTYRSETDLDLQNASAALAGGWSSEAPEEPRHPNRTKRRGLKVKIQQAIPRRQSCTSKQLPNFRPPPLEGWGASLPSGRVVHAIVQDRRGFRALCGARGSFLVVSQVYRVPSVAFCWSCWRAERVRAAWSRQPWPRLLEVAL